MKIAYEKAGVVKQVDMRDSYSIDAAKKGFRLDIDTHDLPKDGYYLQGIYSGGRVESTRIVVQ